MPKARVPELPHLLHEKIYKTGQTRGASDDEIYQNRVARSSTVLIPFHQWEWDPGLRALALGGRYFAKGYIVLIPPGDYFSVPDPTARLKELALDLGKNCLVFYETRQDWDTYTPAQYGWEPANSRSSPLGGEYVARVPSNTSRDASRAQKINIGYSSQSSKGAGIRLYEYAAPEEIEQCKLQLEAIFWLCGDALEVVVRNGISQENAILRRQKVLEKASANGLLDFDRLREHRIINRENHTICPLCLQELSGAEFLSRMEQPQGREVPDLTVTQVNLFHIEELKFGAFNHRAYNLGWGHHFCNVVVKDSGIYPTLEWMQSVLQRNRSQGYLD